MAAFHGCHTTLHYLNLYHSSYEAPMAAYHHPHYPSYEASMAALHNCKTTLYYPPQHHLEFSSTIEDRLEAALAKLTLSQHNLTTSIDTLATTIDNLLQRLPCNPTPHFSSFFPPQTSSPPQLLKPTPSPTRTAFTTVPLPPVTTPPPPPPPATTPPSPPFAPIQLQSITSPRPTILPAPHAKQEEQRAIALFELGPGFFGSIMVSRKCRPAVLALRAGAKLSEFCRHRPWDPGITLVVMVERITLKAR
ncbi:hypothetical protein HKD37_15G044010 [Glycine soja]